MIVQPQPRWKVPPNWVWATLSQLGEIVGGGTPSTTEPSYWGDEITWIAPSDLTGYSRKTIRNGARGISKLGADNSTAIVMPAGSVHFSSRAPIGHVVISSLPTATSQGFKSLIPAPGILNSYVYYYLIASRDYARKRASGTTFPELTGKAFGGLSIPIPSAASQHRIVENLEALLSDVDDGIKKLEIARTLLDVYRHVLLKHAFEGILTAQWRKENNDRLETPEQLLDRIKREQATRYEQQLSKWIVTVKKWEEGGRVGRRPTGPRSPRSSATPAGQLEDQRSGRRERPVGWIWLPAAALGMVQLGRQRSPKNRSDRHPTKYIRAANITEYGLDLSDVLDMEFEPHELAAYRLEKGDLILSEASGSATQVGKPAIWDDQIPNCCFQNTVIRHQSYCLDFATYLLWLYRFYYLSGRFAEVAGGVGINHLSASNFARIMIPLCPLAEQREIVRLLEERFAAIEQQERKIDEALKRADGLRQAILKRAFSGGLVAQDPNDEPGSVLLERIRAEREQTKKRRATRKAGRRQTARQQDGR